MAQKSSATATKRVAAPSVTKARAAKKKPARKTAHPQAAKARETRSSDSASPASVFGRFTAPPMPNPGDIAKLTKFVTPQQAIELYKANAKMALDVINAALESTAKMRRLQFAGEEEARSLGRNVARQAAEASSPNAMLAAGQSVSQEAIAKAMQYWQQMFELIVEMQQRLFTLMEDQMAGVPGVKEAKAAMALMPDLRQAQNVVRAMQGVVTSGGSAFESMQRVMGDFAKMMPGAKR